MLYRIPSTTSIPEITGRNVAHARRSAVERAFLAADLVRDRITFVRWTIKQAAESQTSACLTSVPRLTSLVRLNATPSSPAVARLSLAKIRNRWPSTSAERRRRNALKPRERSASV